MTEKTTEGRRFKALHVRCPQCRAEVDARCVDEWSYDYMRGVHRARAIAYLEANLREGS